MTDIEYMLRAVELAKRGTGAVNPNPLVGAVIVRDDKILAEGWHERYGELHAERNAIKHYYEKNETGSLKGATIYVTLEPCCHHGKQPPCVDAIIENGFARVVIGSDDPNPLVAGKGIKKLRDAGIEVVTGVAKAECDAINYVFFHYIMTKTPYVVMKYAMTMDGKIATVSGKSKWITGEGARKRVHEDRARYVGIMAGIGTVLSDDPELTCRLNTGGEDDGKSQAHTEAGSYINIRNPIRIICDTNLRTPLDSKLVKSSKEVRTILATAITDEKAHEPYIENGCEILVVPLEKSHIDLEYLMKKLGEMGIDSILLEGGGTLNFAALKSGIVNRVQAYIAPKIFGGKGAKTPVEGAGISEVADCVKLSEPTVTMLDGDILVECEVCK